MSKLSIGIIVQARMGSTRLPGKVLKKIGDKVLLQHIIERTKKLKTKHALVIATSNLKKDEVIANYCHQNHVDVFCGDESDVLKRYYDCAVKYSFNHIVRLTADNPYFDYEELDCLISRHIESNSQYANNFEFLPIGIGMEIMTFEALEKSYLEGQEAHHREHVNEFIIENPNRFKTIKVEPQNKSKIRPDIRMTVDTAEDLEKAIRVYNCVHGDVNTLNIIKNVDSDFKQCE
jgi:spore coat polysaccharide biosynthesis protein SpsF